MIQKQKHIQLQVGAFVGVGLILLMIVIFMLGSEKKLFETQYTLVAYFENISGLRTGAPVQLAGINVGSVNQIEFNDREDKKNVKLHLRISTQYKKKIRKDSVASILTQGLLGDKMIFITVGSPDSEELKDGAEILAIQPSGFFQLIEKGDRLIENATEISNHLKSILKEVREGSGLIHSLIYDKDGEDLMQDIAAMAKNLNDASASLDAIISKVNNGEGTIGALVNDASLFNDIKTLLGKANRNKLIRAVIRETLRTRDEKLLKN